MMNDVDGRYSLDGWQGVLAPVGNPDPVFYPVFNQRLISWWDHALPQLIHLIEKETSVKKMFKLDVIAQCWADFTIMMECTPESRHCHSVCKLSHLGGHLFDYVSEVGDQVNPFLWVLLHVVQRVGVVAAAGRHRADIFRGLAHHIDHELVGPRAQRALEASVRVHVHVEHDLVTRLATLGIELVQLLFLADLHL